MHTVEFRNVQTRNDLLHVSQSSLFHYFKLFANAWTLNLSSKQRIKSRWLLNILFFLCEFLGLPVLLSSGSESNKTYSIFKAEKDPTLVVLRVPDKVGFGI